MIRGPLAHPDYKPQFTGHETFPLRYGWLKKAYDAVKSAPNQDNRQVFLSDESIAWFGVGRNMVASIRHWANAVGIINESNRGSIVFTTALGDMLFGADGYDPFLEHASTLWLIHWHLAGRAQKTTWYWVFNYYPSTTFRRDQLAESLSRVAKETSWTNLATSTLKRDVECFVRTYVSRGGQAANSYEDHIESPLSELGLIRSIGKKDGFQLIRGPKPNLGPGVFAYTLLDFWKQYTSTGRTLSFETIAHEPGSPGRVFLLNEDDLADRLIHIEDSTKGLLQWSETSGVKQLIMNQDISTQQAFNLVWQDYL